jgi:carboxypeptidase T
MMKRILFTFFLCVVFLSLSLAEQPRYSRVKIFPDRDLSELGVLGLPMDNMEFKPGEYLLGEYSEHELKKLDAAGVPYEVLIWDMAYFYRARNEGVDKAEVEAAMRQKRPGRRYQTPANFTLGSMGGFHTNAEVMQDLDLMKILYPDLISTRQPISETKTTHECRPVYWVRISNDPEQLQDKPRVLYTGLTHAREPASMQQMLFQMWYLLENYGSDPEITYLVDNTEMYFIPVVNPDGYIYNQTTHPHGGGMHRKNMRVNAPNDFGVDLNRNFGYQWGYDNVGSSPNTWSNVYRGPAPFSEPETQMLKEFAETYNFKLALNNHTYSDLLIYPWGYTNQLTPDGDVFVEFAKLLTRENNYTYGTVYETLHYFANGVSDDWFYGEQETKDKVFAFTPEAGSPADGFWPATYRIEDICAGHTGMNLYLARLALPYAEIVSNGAKNVKQRDFYYPVEITSFGLDTPATFTVSINPLSPLITDVGAPLVFEDMGLLEIRKDSIRLELHPATFDGLLFDFEVVLDNGLFAWRDTVARAFGWPNYIVFDDFENDDNWVSDTWGLATNYYISEPHSMTDSPGGNYPNNYNAVLDLAQPVDLTNYSMAYAEFYTRWDIERNYDYAQFLVSDDGGLNWTPMPGQFTQIGTTHQDTGQPLYHGAQNAWVLEQVSLDDFLGKEILLRFRLVSDHTITRDGFYFDNFGVVAHVAFDAQPPQIVDQVLLELPMGESFVMEHSLLTVVDEFIPYPEGHTLTLHPGAHYTIDQLTVTPDSDFEGEMLVDVSVSNGVLESDIYQFRVTYFDPLTAYGLNASFPHLFYSREREVLTIDPGNKLKGAQYLLILYDVFGREVLRTEWSNDGQLVTIPMKLKPGIYLFEIRGEVVHSGKIPAF